MSVSSILKGIFFSPEKDGARKKIYFETDTDNVIDTSTNNELSKSLTNIKNDIDVLSNTQNNQLLFGTAVTGISSAPTIFNGIDYTNTIYKNTYYINIDTLNVYKCVSGGTKDKAKWIYQLNINKSVYDSGWIDLKLYDGFTARVGYEPQIRRIGNIVYIRGQIKTDGLSSSKVNYILQIPEGFRPLRTIQATTCIESTYLVGMWADPMYNCILGISIKDALVDKNVILDDFHMWTID